jgi:hypothetical protein
LFNVVYLGVEIRLPTKNRLAAAPGDYKSFCLNIKYKNGGFKEWGVMVGTGGVRLWRAKKEFIAIFFPII